jgi:hypothetical protein
MGFRVKNLMGNISPARGQYGVDDSCPNSGPPTHLFDGMYDSCPNSGPPTHLFGGVNGDCPNSGPPLQIRSEVPLGLLRMQLRSALSAQ